jgi:hypothetical protein
MARNTKKIDESSIKAAIAAVRNRKYPDVVPASQQSQILNLRRKLGKQIQPLFADAGLEIKKINKILAEHQRDVRGVVDKHKAKTAKNVSALNKNMRLELANRSKALENINVEPFLPPTIIQFEEAAQIWATPVGMLTDSGIEANYNWAKFQLVERSDGYNVAYVRFYFFWQNTSDYLAVLNANTDLAAQGIVQANATPELFSGGFCSVRLDATLKVFFEGEVYSYQGTQLVNIDSISVNGGSELWMDGNNFASHTLDGALNPLSVSDIQVQAGQTVMFEVALAATYSIGDGSITLDFSYGDYLTMCPGLTIELLTPPTMVNVVS